MENICLVIIYQQFASPANRKSICIYLNISKPAAPVKINYRISSYQAGICKVTIVVILTKKSNNECCSAGLAGIHGHGSGWDSTAAVTAPSGEERVTRRYSRKRHNIVSYH